MRQLSSHMLSVRSPMLGRLRRHAADDIIASYNEQDHALSFILDQYSRAYQSQCCVVEKRRFDPDNLNAVFYGKFDADAALQISGEELESLLQMCREQSSLQFTKMIHLFLCVCGLETQELGKLLMHVYSERGNLSEALQVFHKLVNRNEHTWTCLIRGYSERGDFHTAFRLLYRIQGDSLIPRKVAYVALLKACAGKKFLERTFEVHDGVVRDELESDLFICNTLISVYTKCSSFLEAKKVFDNLLVPNTVSWTALVAGYVEHGLGSYALGCLGRMHLQAECPNSYSYSSFLKACGNTNARDVGKRIHCVLIADEFRKDLAVDNALVYMYSKLGLLVEAEELFSLLQTHDVVTWTALIAAFVENGLVDDALQYIKRMKNEGVPWNSITSVSSLKVSSNMEDHEMGKNVHMDIVKHGFDTAAFVGNALVDMYAKIGLMREAELQFDHLEDRSNISWNTLLAGYCEVGLGDEALLLLRTMQMDGVELDDVTFICALRACGYIRCIEMVQCLHIEITKRGYEDDHSIGNNLVEVYAKCSAFPEARMLLTNLPITNVISWTVIISHYVEYGLAKEALDVLELMQQEGVHRDAVTFIYGLQACGNIAASVRGQNFHIEIVMFGIEQDTFVSNSLVDMYGKCYLLDEACHVFHQLSEGNIVGWSALIGGHVESDLYEDALKLVEKMRLNCMCLNAAIFVSSLKACSAIGAINKGRELYCEITKKGFISVKSRNSPSMRCSGTNATEDIIENALITMYAKSGILNDAMYIFNRRPKHKIAALNTLISSLTMKENAECVFFFFQELSKEFLQPNEVTILSILTACSHVGFVEVGQQLFMVMGKGRDIVPDIQHYNCMIDLFARAGQLEEAVRILEEMPLQPKVTSWNTILAACRKWGYVELGERVLENLLKYSGNCTAAFISMYNINVDNYICEIED